MVLTAEQKQFFNDNGYLKYERVLSDEQLDALRQRSEDIAMGRATHIPPRYIQQEKEFRDGGGATTVQLDTVRKMTHLSYFDDVFEATAKNPRIVEVIEELMGPNIKLYTDQLMMKPRYHGTVTGWHQDSPSWRYFMPQAAVSCWVALDDATVENGCMTVIPGSHKLGPLARDYLDAFLNHPLVSAPTPVEVKAGHCMFHHGLNLHMTGANTTPNRRRGLALHYIKSETMYLGGDDDEEARLMRETEKPKGTFRFMLIKGKEFPGRV